MNDALPHVKVQPCGEPWRVPDVNYCQSLYQRTWKMLLFGVPGRGGMSPFVTVVMDSASLRGACANCVAERLSLCFHARSRTCAPLERTTKACLSNRRGVRLGSKDSHKANVSVRRSGERICQSNQEKTWDYIWDVYPFVWCRHVAKQQKLLSIWWTLLRDRTDRRLFWTWAYYALKLIVKPTQFGLALLTLFSFLRLISRWLCCASKI